MRNPPRRSRPKRPGTTIDLKAETLGTVGYAGPVSPGSDDVPAATGIGPDVLDPETQLASSAPVDAVPADLASVSESADLPDRADHDVSQAREPLEETTSAFAEEEGLRTLDADGSGRRTDEFDDETILAAAEPDLAAREEDPSRPSGPASPSYDYTAATTQHQPDGRGGGFGSALGGGLLGAVLALLGAGALQYSGVLPSLGREDPAELAQQFASTGDVQQVVTDYGVLRADVEQLKSAQAAGGAGTGATTADLNAVADRVTAIEQRAAQAPAPVAPVDDGSKAAADQASKAAAAANQVAAGAKAAADKATQGAAEAAKTAAAANTTAEAAAADIVKLRQATEAATAALAAARQTGENAIQAAATAQQTGTTAQAAATAAQQSAGTANAAIEALTPRLAALEPRIAAIEPRIAGIEAGGRQAAAAIAAASLKAAIDRGGPFMGELETFAEIAGASPVVDTLRDHAASGVPAAPTLAAQWPSVETQIREALKPRDPDADVGNQILVGLGALVTTRPAGGAAPAAADGPGAAVSRLNAAMTGGDLAAWLAEWQSLPEAAKEASRAFQAKVAARTETDGIVGKTLTDAVKAVGQPVGTAG